jgi:hypothetical protein
MRMWRKVKADRAGWYPIVSAPKDGTVIDLWIPYVDFEEEPSVCRVPTCFWVDNGWLDIDSEPLETDEEPTHWRPMPGPPERRRR